MITHRIALIVGSLRKDSYNRKLAQALVEIAPPALQLEIVEIGQLPLYNEDNDEEDAPASYTEFRAKLKAFDGVIFVTPEYNRSMPGALKNAIDVGSRPYGQSVWSGKPAAIVSASPGAMGGFGANHHLRQSLVFLDMPTLQQPEMYLSGVDKVFGADGKLVDRTRDFLGKFLGKYAAWVGKQLAGENGL
jgi:chromate reductase